MSRQYGNFKLVDYFDIRYGKFVKKNQIGDTPYITTTAFNNGIGGSLDAEPMFKGNCITIASDGSVGSTFYQQNPFSASNIVVVLEPKETTPLNRYNAQYLATRIRVYAEQTFDYGKKFSVNRVRATELEFPMTDEGNIDWEYMETYMKTIEEESEHIIEMLNSVTLNGGGLTLEPYSFGEFKVGDLFNVTSGKRVKKADWKDGEIPYVTASIINNGIDGYIGNPIFTSNNLLTINFFGNVFYQQGEVSFKDGTYGYKLKEEEIETKNVYLYLASILESKLLPLGSYDNALRPKRINEEYIKLPIKPTGDIDWEYMENYMRMKEEEALMTIELLNKVTL